MGLETVKEEIIRNAKEQEASILAEARKEASRMLKEAEARVGEKKAKSEADIKKATDAMKKQAIASAEMESKKMALEARKQVIEKVFEEVRKKLEDIDDKKRESYLKKLLERAKSEIDIGYAYCNKRDAKFLKGSGAEPAGILGGLIAENKDKTIRVDYSFETLLDSIKDREMQNINKLLFG